MVTPCEVSLPPLLIRADGGPALGLGHVLRSLVLGRAWQERGGHVEFLGEVSGGRVRERLRAEAIPLREIRAAPGSADDCDATLAALRDLASQGDDRPWVLLDGYSFGPEYERALREAECRVLMVDDTAHQPFYAADIVLNQNLGAEELVYECAPETVLLLGTRYVLLRQEFRRAAQGCRQTPYVARRVLVTMGGSDPVNATSTVLEALHRVKVDGLEVLTVIGPANPHRDALRRCAASSGAQVRLLESPDDLPALMAGVDLAITGGGGTCWELAYLGVPFVVLQLAENQVGVARSLAAAGAAVDAGWHSSVNTSALAALIEELCYDAPRREDLRRSAGRVVDGRGAERVTAVVEALSSRCSNGVGPVVRRADWGDRFQLWRLANDPVLRANSFHRPEISLDQHLSWYRDKMTDADTLLLVLDVGGVVAAQVRYDRRTADLAEVHFAVAPAFRGRGLGTGALQQTWRMAREALGIKRIEGVVLIGNVPSARAFRSAGYRLHREDEMRGFPCHVFELECEPS